MVFTKRDEVEFRRLSDSRFRGENPLEMIGLSHQILNLKLNQEQLHKLCLKIAKFLLAEHHEDHCGSDPAAKRQALRFSEALAKLKDKEVFEIYLGLFRESRSEEKSEVNEWRRSYKAIREQLLLKEKEIARLRKALKLRNQP
jgi:hypothetical protein